MNEQNMANGVLFYAAFYTSVILLAVTILTGRFVFAVLIVLTFALVTYVMTSIQCNAQYIADTGKWFQSRFVSMLENVKNGQWFSLVQTAGAPQTRIEIATGNKD